MKTLVIGDIHGMYDELMRALDNAGYSDGDRIIGLGDYLDYGPQTREVLNFLCAAKRGNPGSIWIRGNHENVFLRALLDNSSAEYYSWHSSMLGYTTMKSYGKPHLRDDNVEEFLRQVFPAEHLEFLENTVINHDEDIYRFTHILEFSGNKVVVYGHEHGHRPIIGFYRIGLAVEGGVAVLNLDTGVIKDDEGKEYAVTKQRLYGKYSNGAKE